jgi:hypothetical protein
MSNVGAVDAQGRLRFSRREKSDPLGIFNFLIVKKP